MSYEKVEAKILLRKAQLESAIDRIIHNVDKLSNKQLELLEHTILMEKIVRKGDVNERWRI